MLLEGTDVLQSHNINKSNGVTGRYNYEGRRWMPDSQGEAICRGMQLYTSRMLIKHVELRNRFI
jgi:hypothetical protein